MIEEAFEHYLGDASHIAPPPEGAFTGAAGGAACGDLARISLLIDRDAVRSVTCDSEGCGAIRAAVTATAELVEGSSVLAAARIGADRLERELGGLTPGKRHAAELAADALHRAIAAATASDRTLAAAHSDRVLVAMSGGVDSAVAAALERSRGREVVAVTLKLWADPKTDGAKACCSPEAVRGARALAHTIGLPHLTLDLEQEFRDRVVSRFISGYAAGRTPNPCVLCNGEVRVAAMVDLADRVGATHLVTGHYAQIHDDGDGPLLAPAADPAKDQSYMLAALSPELLGRLRFPLAELTKPEVRELAAGYGLAVARKPESQDLCFLAGEGKRGFLRRHGGLEDREGDVLDAKGRRVGRHRGHHHFTVGQRRGVGVAAAEPRYVLATDAGANTVTIGARDELGSRRVRIRGVTLHRDGDRIDAVRLRYHSPLTGARLSGPAMAGTHPELELELSEPFYGVAPGQTACLMSGDRVVGHGTIA